MIYFLPERIYNYILENKISDVLDKLNALSDKYNSFTTFEEYIKYSSLFIYLTGCCSSQEETGKLSGVLVGKW